jgi:hypothetical protein
MLNAGVQTGTSARRLMGEPGRPVGRPGDCDAKVEPSQDRQDAMTSAQTMLANPRARRALRAVLALAASAALLTGCEALSRKKPELTPPAHTTAPYDASDGDVLWAVLPLLNESGTEIFDPLAVSDKLVAAAEEVEGVRTVPLNRTLQAMHALDIQAVRDPDDVHRIAAAMGVDGVIVGSITAYDPYDPPTIGLSLAL